MDLLKDTIFYSSTKFFPKIVKFITAPILIAHFTPEEYGYLNLIRANATFFSLIGLLAIVDQGLPRFFIDSQNKNDKIGYVSTAYFFSGIGLIGLCIICLVSYPVFSKIYQDINNPQIFSILIVLVCFSNSLQYVGNNLLKWTFQSARFAKINIFYTIANTSVIVCGILIFGWRVVSVIYATVTVTIIFAIWINLQNINYLSKNAISKKKAKELVVYSLPLLGINVFAFFTRFLDRLFIANMRGLNDVGVFAVSATMAGIFETIVGGFFLAWGPYVLASYRKEGSPKRYSEYYDYIALIGILSIIGLGIWGGPFIEIIRNDSIYKEIGVYIPWIVSGTLIYFLGAYFTPGPTIKKKTYFKFLSFLLAAIINALLNFILVPDYGIIGAGIATTIASIIAGCFNQIVSNRLYYIPNRWKKTYILIVVMTATVSYTQSNYFLYNLSDYNLFNRVLITLILLTLVCVIYGKKKNIK